MEIYLLKFSGCLFVLWLVYILAFEHQKIHHFKRFYLLASFVVSLIIPLLTITHYVEPVIQNVQNSSFFIPIESSISETPIQEISYISLKTILWSLYGLGVLLLSFRFILNLIKLYRNISNNIKVSKSAFIYVLLKEYRIPHSFFKYIFLNKAKFDNNDIPKEVLLHEETHAKQLHSVDIILVEILQIVFWFHPLIYIFKHHIRLNHEFLADQAVLNQGTETTKYQNILLQFSSSTQEHKFSSAINYSSFKKRFQVMKTQTSKIRFWLSTLMLLPLIAILFYSFAEREYIEKDALDIKKNVKKANNNQQLEINNNDPVKAYLKKYEVYKKLQNTPPHYVNKSNKEQMKMETLFSDLGGMYFRMSKANKSKVERPTAPILPYAKITLNGKTYFKKKSELTKEERATLPPPPPPPVKTSRGGPNVVDAHEVYNNYARSIELIVLDDNSYLIDGIKATKNSFLKVFNQLHQDVSPEVRKNIMNIHVSSSSEISNEEVWFIYNSLKDYGFYRIVTPNQEINRAKGNRPFAIESSISLQQKIATAREVADYNAWAKRIHSESKKLSDDATWYPPVNEKDLIKYSAVYNRMSSQQKKQAVAYPIPGMELSGSEKNISISEQQKATKQQFAEYNKLAKYYNAMIREDKSVRIKMKDVEKLKYIYNLMSKKQRQNAEPFPDFPKPPPPPSPEAPKLKVKEVEAVKPPEPPKPPKVKETSRSGSHLKDVPPPPPPLSTTDFIIKMAKTKAKFYYESKEISSDKAIAIIKKNPDLNVRAKKTGAKQQVVYISKKPIVIEVKEESKN